MKSKNLYLFFFTLLGLTSCAQQSVKDDHNYTNTPNLVLSDKEWKERLTTAQYHILREKGTERAFTGSLLSNKKKGIYSCAACNKPLFSHDMKFDSGTGWPSFDSELPGKKINHIADKSQGMERVEIACSNCGGHLGHIFNDGPTETGMRYCVNSGSLKFEEGKDVSSLPTLEKITLAGGCFWCLEAIFEDLSGVENVVSGYSGGKTMNPTYNEIAMSNTGHAEVIQVQFDPSIISLESLLEVFFALHDPTTLNKQGADEGTQYRSAIFYHNDDQNNVANKIISTLNLHKAFEKPIVTEVSPFKNFFEAENYHQEYYKRNKEAPYCRAVIKPKMDKLHKIFSSKLKN